MGTTLCMITNSQLTGTETRQHWDQVLQKLKNLDLAPTIYLNSKNEWVSTTGNWEYFINKEFEPYGVEFEGPTSYSLTFYPSVGELSCIYSYR